MNICDAVDDLHVREGCDPPRCKVGTGTPTESSIPLLFMYESTPPTETSCCPT